MALTKESLLAAIENETDFDALRVLQTKLEVVERLAQNRIMKISALQSTKLTMENNKENSPATDQYTKVVSTLNTLISEL